MDQKMDQQHQQRQHHRKFSTERIPETHTATIFTSTATVPPLLSTVNTDTTIPIINNNNNDGDGGGGTSPSSTTSSSTLPPIPPISPLSTMFVVKNYHLIALWCWMKQFRAIGICMALASVLFWSFNGLSYKLNHNIHALEILTISSFVVSLFYLGLMFTLYGVRYRSKTNNWNAKLEPFNWTLLLGIPGERSSLMMRCLCGTISLACFYSSYRYIPLGDATTIRFTSPVFIAIFAHFIVNEPFGLLQIVNSITTLIGVILIGRPSFLFGTSPLNDPITLNVDDKSPLIYNNSFPLWRKKAIHHTITTNQSDSDDQPSNFDPMDIITIFTSDPLSNVINDEQDLTTAMTNDNIKATTNLLINDWSSTLLGVFLSLVAAISISISMIFMRKLKKTPPPLVIFWFSLSNVILGAIGLWVIGEYRFPNTLFCWVLILMTTICTGLDQLFITLALKLENAGAVAVIQALCVVLSFVFSISILHEPLYWTSALGGTFIFFSVLMLGCSKLLQEMNYSHIKSTIFAINILHSNSKKKFKLPDDPYSKFTSKLSLSPFSYSTSTTNNNNTVISKNYRPTPTPIISSSSSSSKLSSLLSSSLSFSSATAFASRRNTLHSLNNNNYHINMANSNEPYLLRIAPILGNGVGVGNDHHDHHHHLCGICIQRNHLDLNNNDNGNDGSDRDADNNKPSFKVNIYQ